MTQHNKIAFLFPGQGAQYPGMGKDFADNFAVARRTFEEADDLLQRKLSKIIFEGPENLLTQTKNSQVAIYVNSIAVLRSLQELLPQWKPSVCAGLSVGEYTALTASGHMSFQECLPIVQHRGEFMHDACESTKGGLAAVLGLEGADVEEIVSAVNLPNDLWVANFNSSGQVVISGTEKGLEAGMAAVKAKGAKRVIPLQVHGAFHSGLMVEAEKRLKSYLEHAPVKKSAVGLVMNVPGDFVEEPEQIRRNLMKQVTGSVRWEQGVRAMVREGVDCFVEIGCGRVLTGLNKRNAPGLPSYAVEKVKDLEELEKALTGVR